MSEGPVVAARLDSWKEIASYVGRNVRTVIRWEKERGLPVHRVPGGGRQAVFAFPDEIDSWMQGRFTARDSLETAGPVDPRQPDPPSQLLSVAAKTATEPQSQAASAPEPKLPIGRRL